jgi:hypothetical protein
MAMVSPDGQTSRKLTSRKLLGYGFSKDLSRVPVIACREWISRSGDFQCVRNANRSGYSRHESSQRSGLLSAIRMAFRSFPLARRWASLLAVGLFLWPPPVP